MSIQEELNASIPKECIADKKGLSYISHRYVKQRLNEVFGWDGWEYTIQEVTLNREKMEAFVHVRLEVFTGAGDDDGFGRPGITRDGIAVGFLPKPRDKAKHETWANNSQGFDFAVAEGVTDALKRAAVSLGNSLGLELYPMVPKGQEKKSGGAAPRPRPTPTQKKMADNAVKKDVSF
jgi:hypothetical protein